LVRSSASGQNFVGHRLAEDIKFMQQLSAWKSPDQIAAAYTDRLLGEGLRGLLKGIHNLKQTSRRDYPQSDFERKFGVSRSREDGSRRSYSCVVLRGPTAYFHAASNRNAVRRHGSLLLSSVPIGSFNESRCRNWNALDTLGVSAESKLPIKLRPDLATQDRARAIQRGYMAKIYAGTHRKVGFPVHFENGSWNYVIDKERFGEYSERSHAIQAAIKHIDKMLFAKDRLSR
jgi:hypothetical protein